MHSTHQFKNIAGRPVILASASPRRRELLQALGLPFEIKKADIDEDFPLDLSPREVARYLAEKKAAFFKNDIKDEIVITADTIVLLHDKILNKPADEKEAREMLTMLSNKKHEVISAVGIATKAGFVCFDDTTEVYFRTLSTDEIDYYIQTYQPFDKAGSYGIQEWIGMIAIEKIVGSYFTVMGLPIHKLYSFLKEIK